MARLTVNDSEHATPGYIVATCSGQIVWSGPAKEFGNARGYDALHCHTADAVVIRRVLAGKNISTNVAA